MKEIKSKSNLSPKEMKLVQFSDRTKTERVSRRTQLMEKLKGSSVENNVMYLDIEVPEKFLLTEVVKAAEAKGMSILEVLHRVVWFRELDLVANTVQLFAKEVAIYLAAVLEVLYTLLSEGTYGYKKKGVRLL